MDKEIFLCVPCLNACKAEGQKLRKSRNSRDKGTCHRCQRRRFGDYYTTDKK